MSLLDNLSKPRWQHPKAKARLAAVDELDDREVLLEILQTDEDPAVRSRALARIAEAAVLDRLIDDPPQGLDETLRQQARAQRLSQLLDPDGSLPAEADEAALMRIALLAGDEPVIDAALARLSDPQSRMKLALGHPVARVRLAAAQSIHDIERLQSLLRQAKHRDKAVFRYCRERVDEHLAEQRAEEELRQNLSRLAEDAAALRAAVDSPEYRGQFLRLQQRWSALGDHAPPDERERIQRDLDACARRVEVRTAQLAAEEQKQTLSAHASQTFVDLLAELDALEPAVLASIESAGELEARLNSIEERWVAALHHAQPEPEQTQSCKERLALWRAPLQTLNNMKRRSAEFERFEKALSSVDMADFKAVQKLQQQAAKWVRAMTWPEAFEQSTPDPIRRLQAQRKRLDEHLAQLQRKERTTLEKTAKAFQAIHTELAAKNIRKADSALNRLRNLLRQLSPAQQDHWQRELRPLLVRLQEIHDWQGFAIEPKKQELIGQMQALVGSDEDPDTLAAKIKALQSEWKALGPLTPRRDRELWEAFRAAADAAWAPCKAAFKQRAEARKQIYRQRMAVIAQLKDYEANIAWPDRENPDLELPAPDWKMVRKTLSAARKAFTELTPVDHKQERKSRKALDKVCNRIYAHLELEYGRNIERKKALVDEAKALVDMENLDQAIDRAKAIQREWKDVGLTPQKVDRPLWKAFRKACDAVFARLGEERDRRQAEQRARSEERRAAERARAERKVERQREEQARWQRLLDRMWACAIRPDEPDRATRLWGAEGDLPKGIDAEALDAWWNEPPHAPDAEACRTACIALEVLTGRDSPPEDREARMAYQMQRLVEGMGSGKGNEAGRQLDLINAFIAEKPSSEWLERFCKSLPQS